jgi:hypothetical protein
MVSKPDRVFDRDREWNGLASFASNPVRGALLGVVSGRRRQGKSFLLEALTSVTGGLYFPSLEETEAVSLRTFSTAMIRQGVPVSRPLQNWGDAIALLFGALRDEPRTVVIDEFPFLVKLRRVRLCPRSSSGSSAQAVRGKRAPRGCCCAARPCRSWAACLPGSPRCAAEPASNC